MSEDENESNVSYSNNTTDSIFEEEQLLESEKSTNEDEENEEKKDTNTNNNNNFKTKKKKKKTNTTSLATIPNKKTNNQKDPFSNLSDELLIYIFSYFTEEELIRFQICTRWRRLLSDDQVYLIFNFYFSRKKN